ncbi:MAG: peptidylprolyl isomerase [Ferruginibacter sp.]|nr:peptidylprolyl isomerase [Ferruginibacter sp.]
MKKIITLFILCLGATQLFSQTLFTYGPYQVGKDEFLRAYNKNKTPVTNKEQSLKEYLDLYSRFKLKVKTAQEQRLDTLPQLQNDLQNFRNQVADGYMNDEKGLNLLIEEAIQRSQKDIHLLHFSIAIPSKMSAADTLKAYTAMNELVSKLKEGKTNYSAITDQISEKYMKVKGDDLGYITALTLPYEIENLVYKLKPGGISNPYRTKAALHVFKNADERKSAGKWKIAQVLLTIPPDVSGAELKAIEKKADSIYALLTGGADFATLAKQLSEDKLTYMNGGEMPEFGTGKYELPFESKVFELKKDGDISKPIFTGYGYHIVKRLQQRDIPGDKSDEAFVAALKQQISADSRINATKAGFLKTVKIKTGYKKNAIIKDTDLFKYADSVAATNQVRNYPINNKTIFSFTQLNVKGSDWLNFVKDYKLNRDVYKGEDNKELLEKYTATTSFEYYRKHLEAFDKDFKYQVQEFKEGNMLFEIMERNVWNKAAGDSTGLQNYYNEHKANYKWAASADILLFNCSDGKVAEEASSALKNGKNWKKLAEESDGKIQADSGRYELSQLPLPQGSVIIDGLLSAPVTNSGDNTSSFVKVLKMFPANQQRSFEEAKGLVINDYQTFLEEKWVAALKKKYPVKVNEVVFRSMLQ